MKSLFMKTLDERFLHDRWNSLSHSFKPPITKFIQFDLITYKDQWQFGITFNISWKDKIYMSIEDVTHGHIWIDLGKWCLEISIMDYKGWI